MAGEVTASRQSASTDVSFYLESTGRRAAATPQERLPAWRRRVEGGWGKGDESPEGLNSPVKTLNDVTYLKGRGRIERDVTVLP